MNKLIYTLAGAAIVLTACDKIEEGYMSDNVYYVENPYTVEQGSTVNSPALELDMSTTPVKVKLLDIRNITTGMTEEAWYGNSDITYWTASPSIVEDTTLELLQNKYTYNKYPRFKVNETGGRLEFSKGTDSVPVGEYEIDVVVENMKETRYMYNACNIILKPASTFVAGAIDGNTDETGAGGSDNASNAGFSKTGTEVSPAWNKPFAYYTFMTRDELDDMKHRLDSVCDQYNLDKSLYGYREDLSYMLLKITDSQRKSFKWIRNHSERYDTSAAYNNVTDINGNPVKSEIRPLFSGSKIQDEYAPFDRYSPWLLPVYCGDYLVCAFPVAPYPATNIKEGVTYCRYSIPAEYVSSDCDVTVLVNFRVGRAGLFVAELQLVGDFTVTSTRDEDKGTELYKGPIKRK